MKSNMQIDTYIAVCSVNYCMLHGGVLKGLNFCGLGSVDGFIGLYLCGIYTLITLAMPIKCNIFVDKNMKILKPTKISAHMVFDKTMQGCTNTQSMYYSINSW